MRYGPYLVFSAAVFWDVTLRSPKEYCVTSQRRQGNILLSNFAIASGSVQCAYRSRNLLKLKNGTPVFHSKWKYEKLATVVRVLRKTQNLVISRCCLQMTAKKWTKFYNGHTQLLFFPLNLLFGSVLVAIDPLHKWRLNLNNNILGTSLTSRSCFKTKEIPHECEAMDVPRIVIQI